MVIIKFKKNWKIKKGGGGIRGRVRSDLKRIKIFYLKLQNETLKFFQRRWRFLTVQSRYKIFLAIAKSK